MQRMAGVLWRVVAVLAAGLLALAAGGCAPRFDDLHLTVTTGNPGAVYHQLGTVLATEWTRNPGIPAPRVLTSDGSGENLDRLLDGRASVGFSAADAAADRAAKPGGEHLRALARMHDDYLQLVVRDGSPVQRLADLRGLRVSVGPDQSGVQLIAKRLLHQVNIADDQVSEQKLNIDQAADALRTGSIDAFFWSGGVPTKQITDLTTQLPIRLIDLSDVLPAIRSAYQEYGTAIIPTSSYHLAHPVTTLLVRNFLMVTDKMPDPVAEALTRGVFAAQPALAARNIAARSIDIRSGLETMPIELHPGALAFYRSSTLL